MLPIRFCSVGEMDVFLVFIASITVVVLHKAYWGSHLFFPQAYLKHLKKQQKELNSLKKKHHKGTVFCVYSGVW